MPKSVNEVFRDFVRWTGDGLPNEPVGHPLPIGDPRSGLWNPPKRDIRDALGWVFDAADRAEDAADAAADYAASATGTPQFAARATAEAATIPAYANTIFVEGQAYRLDPAGTDLVTAGGTRWTRVRADDIFPSAFAQTTDPDVLRAALGLNADRFTDTTGSGVFVLDSSKFLPNSTAVSGNASAEYTFDVAGMLIGQTYAVYNVGAVGGRVILDCGEEYAFLGMGIRPDSMTTRQVTVEAGQVAFMMRVNTFRIHVWTAGSYWNVPNASTSWRRNDDGTFEIRSKYIGSIPATSEVAVTVPAEFSLDAALVQSVAIQPLPSGAAPTAGMPPLISKMGTTNSLSANAARLYNPNGSTWVHPVLITFTNVTRA